MKLPAQLEAGDKLPDMHFPPVTRTTLALYCGGSGDHNPIHIDIDYARKAGLDDVIAHGMLVKAYIGRAITAVVEQQFIIQFDTQFLAPTHVGDSVTVSLILGAAGELDREGLFIIEAEATNQDGVLLARSQVKVGDATMITHDPKESSPRAGLTCPFRPHPLLLKLAGAKIHHL